MIDILFIRRLQQFLEASGVSAMSLSKQSGVSNATISRLRREKQTDCLTETKEKLQKAMALLAFGRLG